MPNITMRQNVCCADRMTEKMDCVSDYCDRMIAKDVAKDYDKTKRQTRTSILKNAIGISIQADRMCKIKS
jgi:hypothetical protein